MNKFIATFIAAFVTVSSFAFNYDTDYSKYREIEAKLRANHNNGFAEEAIVNAENFLKELDADIKNQTDVWKLRYLKVYTQVFFQRNQDKSFTDKLNAATAKMKEINLSEDVNKGELYKSLFVFYDIKSIPEVYAYIKADTKSGWQKIFVDGGYYAEKTGNYKEAYYLYIESNLFYDRALRIAIEQLNDSNLALTAAKGIAGKKVIPENINSSVEYIINNLYLKSTSKTEIISILEDINFTYSQYLKKENKYLEPLTKVRQTLDAYYSVKR